MEILRRGCEGEDVRRWQHFLLGQELLDGAVDGVFGPLTETATKAFQKKRKLTVDGMVGPQPLAAALQTGLDLGFTDPLGGTSGPDWPAQPAFKPLISNLERGKIFGVFKFTPVPGSDAIRIVDDWESGNIVTVTLPQLVRVEGAPKTGRIRMHRLVAAQTQALFPASDAAKLRTPILNWPPTF